MRYLFLALMLAPAHSTLAANGGFAEAISSTARATGMNNQFGTRCGLDADLLRRHKAKFEAEARTANATLPAGQAVDVEAEYKVGFDEANRFYDGVKDTPQREMLCQKFAEQIQLAVSHPSVLSLPTARKPSR